jgi:hypothetical protein
MEDFPIAGKLVLLKLFFFKDCQYRIRDCGKKEFDTEDCVFHKTTILNSVGFINIKLINI